MAVIGSLHSRLNQGIGRGTAVGMVGLLLLNVTAPAFARTPDPKVPAPRIESRPATVSAGLPRVPVVRGTAGQLATFGKPVAPVIQRQGSLLDEVGRLNYRVSAEQVAIWKSEATPLARLRLAELTLSGYRDPRGAEYRFAQIISSPDTSREVAGLAKRGKAFALHFQGRYREAAQYLRRLVSSSAGVPSTRELVGFMRHAEACAGYHEAHDRLGIFQPGKLDPLCGVRSVAKAVTRFGGSYNETAAAKVVRHDGFGSDLKDIVKGIQAFGYEPVIITGNERAVAEMPMPVIAHVEHDHFITVTSASRASVTYWCVDCGGDQVVTWDQWHAMEPDVFVSVVRPGSAEAQLISAAFDPGADVVASINPRSNPFSVLARCATLLPLGPVPGGIVCGARPQSLQCGDCANGQSCPVVTGGPGTGDPVNIATGGEEYKPAPDLVVYNPAGPSVSWGREYFSLGNPVENGFGTSWTHSYNFVVNISELSIEGRPGGGGGELPPPAYAVDLILPNSAHLKYGLPEGEGAPTALNPGPVTLVPEEEGAAYIVRWKYDTSAGGDFFEIQGADETVLRTTMAENYPAPGQPLMPFVRPGWIYRLSKITDKVGNFITLDYEDKTKNVLMSDGAGGTYSQSYTLRNLKTIRDASGSALLTLNTDAQGSYVSAIDRYSRAVYYSVQTLSSANMPNGIPNEVYELTQASQIVTAGAGITPVRYQYTYALVGNMHGVGGEQVPTLKTISVPSPTGLGLSTATINYDADGLVSSLVDANGNTTEIVNDPSINRAEIRVKDSSGTVVEKRYLDFDAKMNLTQVLDASGNVVSTKTFGGTNPYKPTSVTDATSHTWNYTWDQYGHLLTVQTPRGITTTNTYDFSVFPMGRLTETQEGTKTSSTYQYLTNGLLWKSNSPIPGDVGTGNRQTTTYAYDSLGNITSIITPGNNAETTHTTSFNYTTDGSYSQAAAMGQPLTITNSNGEVTHMRYDARANTTSMWDALGNTSTYAFNLANQQTDSYLPATGNTGSGNARSQQVYLYIGGPASQTNAYNESGTLVRQTNLGYGAEGELLSRTGSTEEASFTYNAAYRMKTLRDGAGSSHETSYTYNTKGQVTQISYPNASGATYDKIQFTGYDIAGRLTGRTDGRGITTTYSYAEPDGQLHGVTYSSGAAISMAYDSYGRVQSVTDSS
ncbi:MAG: hypothetical protein JNM85_00210, partial [Chthonomonas sp.]|nr:hypothetical protein [Chthonomonas sp.]